MGFGDVARPQKTTVVQPNKDLKCQAGDLHFYLCLHKEEQSWLAFANIPIDNPRFGSMQACGDIMECGSKFHMAIMYLNHRRILVANENTVLVTRLQGR